MMLFKIQWNPSDRTCFGPTVERLSFLRGLGGGGGGGGGEELRLQTCS